MKVRYKGDVRTHMDYVGSFSPGDVVDLPDEVAKNLVKTNPNFVLVKDVSRRFTRVKEKKEKEEV